MDHRSRASRQNSSILTGCRGTTHSLRQPSKHEADGYSAHPLVRLASPLPLTSCGRFASIVFVSLIATTHTWVYINPIVSLRWGIPLPSSLLFLTYSNLPYELTGVTSTSLHPESEETYEVAKSRTSKYMIVIFDIIVKIGGPAKTLPTCRKSPQASDVCEAWDVVLHGFVVVIIDKIGSVAILMKYDREFASSAHHRTCQGTDTPPQGSKKTVLSGCRAQRSCTRTQIRTRPITSLLEDDLNLIFKNIVMLRKTVERQCLALI
jgi:hypothetical protein